MFWFILHRRSNFVRNTLISNFRPRCINSRDIPFFASVKNFSISHRFLTTTPSGNAENPDASESPTFHQIDRLKARQWRLIYYNNFHEKFEDAEFYLAAGHFFLILGAICSTAILLLILPSALLGHDQQQSHDRYGPWLILLSTGIVLSYFLLLRYRRLRVSRIYQVQPSYQPAKKTSGKLPLDEDSDFCFVYKSALIFRSKCFYFKKNQVKGGRERSAAMAMLMGNFRARGRPWNIYKEYFAFPKDYDRLMKMNR